jgi:branched-chain amino acid transport system substrate-binding protein
VAAQAGIPFITSGAGSPTLPDQVPDWLFLACCGDNAQAAAGAQYAVRRLGARRAAVVYDSSLEPESLLARYFAESFAAQGGVVAARAGFDGSAGELEDLEGLAGGEVLGGDPGGGKRRGSGPDLVYLAVAAADAGALVRELRGAGYGGVIMGGDGFEDGPLREVAAATGGDVVFTSHAPLGLAPAGSATARFAGWYEAAYGRPPENTHACLGFDAVELVAAAIVTARSAEPSAVRAALLATQGFDGVTGKLSYAVGKRVPRKEVTVIEVGRRERVAATFVPGDVPQPWLQP